jgi:phosphatidylserine/phosphatidylglycerophosphate/cardiolipin synthase-like enzyme
MAYTLSMVMIFLLLLTSLASWANPFGPYLVLDKRLNDHFYHHRPPFKLPFRQDSRLDLLRLDLNALARELGPDKMDQLKRLYPVSRFDPMLNLYAWPFAVGAEWEILPYPIVRNVKGQRPAEWIPHFERTGRHHQSYEFIQRINQLTGTEAYAGNQLELLKTPASFAKILEKVKSSRKHIFLATYLFQCDGNMSELVAGLGNAARRGVEVFVIMDKVAARIDPQCFRQMENAGVKVARHTMGGMTKFFHEKMVVFDGEYAMVDGQNMLGSQTLSNGHNNLLNDMAVGVQGPVVQVIGRRFLHHWVQVLKRDMPTIISRPYARASAQLNRASAREQVEQGLRSGSGVCRLLTQDMGDRNPTILKTYLEYLNRTRHYLFFNFIDHVYKKPDGSSPQEVFLSRVVKRANALPNLRVDMLTNNWKYPTDINLTPEEALSKNIFTRVMLFALKFHGQRPHVQMRATRRNLQTEVRGNNFNWWSYAQYMHAKTLMMDNMVSIIGSYNINNISEKDSYEQVLICHDEALAKEMHASILLDLLNSIPVPL